MIKRTACGVCAKSSPLDHGPEHLIFACWSFIDRAGWISACIVGNRPRSTTKSWIPQRWYHTRGYIGRMTSLVLSSSTYISNVSRAQFFVLRHPPSTVGTRTGRADGTLHQNLSFLPRNAGLTGAIQASPSAVPPSAAQARRLGARRPVTCGFFTPGCACGG